MERQVHHRRLAPGVTLNVYHVALGAIDFAFKHRGTSLNGEFYMRELFNLIGCFCLEGKQNLRFTFDVAWLNHSPADQARTDYRVGDTGLLVRSQIQFFF